MTDADMDMDPLFDLPEPAVDTEALRLEFSRLMVDALAEHTQVLDALTSKVESLHQQVAAHKKTNKKKDNTGPSAPMSPAGLRWPYLDRDEADDLWGMTIGYAAWLVDRYFLQEQLPACWARHPALVDELGALALAWHGAHADDADLSAPLRWHESFARARARWEIWVRPTRCLTGRHADPDTVISWPDTSLADTLAVARENVNRYPHRDSTDEPAPEPALGGDPS
ncbi:hypothetical protein AB0M43_23735 [Longispora sp. NPDC051575]|uniref:hypothetical protein n=1 Tax=Longispora sp. NPDC051575 TaxID=3154943 RepID=UPI003434982C